MAFLYITEYKSLARDGQGSRAPMGEEPAVAEQQVAIGVAAQSAAFNPDTKFIMVHADAVCSLLIGDNPTAVVTKKRLAANADRFYAVIPGQKIGVIANT